MANEKRLIDANVLTDEVEKSKYNNPHPPGMTRVNHRNEHDHFLRMILDAPTVDAVEVVHGKWELRPHPYKVFYPEYCCSACGGWKHKLAYEHENMNYCPNCGAKMDGDGNENV